MQFSKLLTFIVVASLVAIVFTGMLTVTNAAAVQPPTEQWNRTFGGAGEDQFTSVQQTADGGYVATGVTKSFGAGDWDAWLVKTDILGHEQWNRTFGGNKADAGQAVQQTADGGYIIIGYTFSFGHSTGAAWLVKTDTDGIEQWNKTINGPGLSVSVYDGQQTKDGGYIIVGAVETTVYSNSTRVWLAKTDVSGNEQWNKTFGSFEGHGQSVQQTADGGYVVAGVWRSENVGGFLGCLIKTDAGGAEQWNNQFGVPYANMFDEVRQTADGGFIIAGQNRSSFGNEAGWLIRTDASGEQLFSRVFPAFGSLSSVQPTADGGYIAAGDGFSDALVIKLDAGGVEQWNKTSSINTNEWAQSIRTTMDGGYIVAGATSWVAANKTMEDARLVKLGPSSPISTTISATAPITAATNQNFTVNGTLSTGTDGIGNATITLRRSADNATWTNITTNVTDATGGYQFSKNESAAGTYYYHATYAGNATYTNATSNVVNVTISVAPTMLNATTSPTAFVNRNFTVNGTLNASTGGIGNATVTLQRSTDNVTFSNVTNVTTDTTGSYQFSKNEPTVGTYYYRTAYDGNATYQNATSNVVTVQVNKANTTLSMGITPTAALVTQQFNVNGTLNTTDRRVIAGATIQLQKNESGKWTNMTGKTSTTTSTGAYHVTKGETLAGTYQYRTVYAGNATYGSATSNVVTVMVTKIPTKLNATAPVNATVSTNFTVKGRLLNGTTPMLRQTITLQRSLDNKTWTNVATNATNTTGWYSFSRKESAAGTYYYHTTYAGNGTYLNVTSNSVKVIVKKPAALTISTSPTTPTFDRSFTLTGTLKSGTIALVGYSVHLERKVGSGLWTDVAGTTKTTGAGGMIPSVSQTMTTHTTYSYRWHFTGTGTYLPCYSPVKAFRV